MEWTFTGAPEYHIICDIPVLRASADNLESKAQFFAQIADSLSALSTDEWQGTAADAFRERFILEPACWTKVQESFLQASQALANYADAMESCQRSTGGLAERYSMANHLMRDFNNRMESGENCDGFEDPSHLYSEIEQEYGRICSDAVLAGQACARALQRACQDAPEERTWLGELVELVYGMGDFFSDTFEFLTAPVTSSYGIGKTYYYAEISGSEALGLIKRPFENAYDVGSAFRMNPWGTIKSFGSAVLDVEKFADDPARVLGNLLPDVALTVGTGGAGLLLKSGSLAKNLRSYPICRIFSKRRSFLQT